ncbi:MAG TPA: hypothetical protein VLK36_05165 [Gaiellaceae bacterium]|nr:hypothetical protein [Gaiellaceae bacterium]
MQDAVSIILASRARLAVALALVAVIVAGGATFGSWAVSSSPGNGYAKAVTAVNLTFNDVSATTVAQLYPGGNGDVKVSVNNPNPFPVTITAVNAAAGSISSDKGAACNASTGVTYTNQTGLTQVVPATGTAAFTLTGAAHMANTSDNSCQGAIFTIPVTLTATS